MPKQSSALRLLSDIMLCSGDAVSLGDAHHDLLQWLPVQVEGFRRQLRRVLRELVAMRASADDDRGQQMPQGVVLERLAFVPVAGIDSVALTVEASARDTLWFQILDLLRRRGLHRVITCPGCSRLLVKNGRREYCSDRCQARVFMRRRRAEGQA